MQLPNMNSMNRQLKRLRKEASPTKTFKKELWAELSKAHDAEYGVHKRSFVFRFAAVGVVVVVLFFSLGTGVYAYESPSVTEGHVLHPLKQGIERMEERFALTPKQRIRFHIKMMGRRLDEFEHMQEFQTEIGQELLSRAADELGISLEELKENLKDPEERRQMHEQLLEQSERYANFIGRVFTSEPAPLADEPGSLDAPESNMPRLRETELGKDLIDLRQEVQDSDMTPLEKRAYFIEEMDKLLEEKGLERGVLREMISPSTP